MPYFVTHCGANEYCCPIIRTVTTAMVLVVKPDFPARDLAQFMTYARSHPDITGGYGSGASQISIGRSGDKLYEFAGPPPAPP